MCSLVGATCVFCKLHRRPLAPSSTWQFSFPQGRAGSTPTPPRCGIIAHARLGEVQQAGFVRRGAGRGGRPFRGRRQQGYARGWTGRREPSLVSSQQSSSLHGYGKGRREAEWCTQGMVHTGKARWCTLGRPVVHTGDGAHWWCTLGRRCRTQLVHTGNFHATSHSESATVHHLGGAQCAPVGGSQRRPIW